MRLAPTAFSIALSAAVLLSACEQKAGDATPPAPVEPVSLSFSDELPGLAAPASGIAFWRHPNVSFNSMMIVASEDGIVSYNIEDGNEVGRIDDVNAKGVAVSYLGFGAPAAGVLAYYDADESAFRFYGVDNNSRAFLPVDGAPSVRNPVRGFCFGRAEGAAAPALFAVQRGKISIFNFEAGADGLVAAGETTLDAPDSAQSCAVDIDGIVLVSTQDGKIYRLAGEESFSAPFASAPAKDAGEITVIAGEIVPANGEEEAEDADPTYSGQIVLLDREDGTLYVFDRADGTPLGAVSPVGTDEITAPEAVTVMGASGANLGALYRNGVIALGAGVEAPSILLLPVNGVMNALSLPESNPINPRGELPEVEDNGLLIETGFKPE